MGQPPETQDERNLLFESSAKFVNFKAIEIIKARLTNFQVRPAPRFAQSLRGRSLPHRPHAAELPRNRTTATHADGIRMRWKTPALRLPIPMTHDFGLGTYIIETLILARLDNRPLSETSQLADSISQTHLTNQSLIRDRTTGISETAL